MRPNKGYLMDHEYCEWFKYRYAYSRRAGGFVESGMTCIMLLAVVYVLSYTLHGTTRDAIHCCLLSPVQSASKT